MILSPHLDDAVLSCWHVLTGPEEVRVITVFAGVPTELTAPAWWDQYTGAVDSGERVRERIEEDRRALALAGRPALNLGFLDEQYRDYEQHEAPLCEQIEPLLAPGARIYAPAAFANHADHVLVRAVAVRLRDAGFAVCLYADLPHATVYGWPAWVKGKRRRERMDLAAALWDHGLAGTGAFAPTVHALDGDSHERKLNAVRMYRSQLQGLEEFAGRSVADREVLGYEVEWATVSPARAVQREGRRL
ncbi:MAG: PIG-L family deacetylase [Solirubrobacterales bacterium]|nr:PIG-L family deacetylase [Solirubrobacterales bacterium]